MAVIAVTVVSAGLFPDRSTKHYKNPYKNMMIAPAPRSHFFAILVLAANPAPSGATEL
jgi:hypothetical protein